MAIVKEVYKPGVLYEYRPGRSVKLQFKGITLVIYKPYALQRHMYQPEAYTGPKITLAANPTAVLNIQDIKLINECTQFGISLLNKEGINLIDVNNWADNYDYEDASNIEIPKPVHPIKKERHKWHKPEINDLFTDGKENYYIYLGNGEAMGFNNYDMLDISKGTIPKLRSLNYYQCYQCYLNVARYSIPNIMESIQDGKLILEDKSTTFTSSRTAKKAYEILDSYSRNIREYELRGNYQGIQTQFIMDLENYRLRPQEIELRLRESRRKAGYTV